MNGQTNFRGGAHRTKRGVQTNRLTHMQLYTVRYAHSEIPIKFYWSGQNRVGHINCRALREIHI